MQIEIIINSRNIIPKTSKRIKKKINAELSDDSSAYPHRLWIGQKITGVILIM